MKTRNVRVTFQKEFVMREDQSPNEVKRMYKSTYGMDVVKVEDVLRCKACQQEVSEVDELGHCKCCGIVRDGIREAQHGS